MDSSGRDLQLLCLATKSNKEINRRIRDWLEYDKTDTNTESCRMNHFIEFDRRIVLNCILNTYRATGRSVEKFLHHRIDNEKRLKKRGESQKSVYCEKLSAPPFALHSQDSRGITPLHLCVYRNSLHVDKIAKVLLDWNSHSDKVVESANDRKEVSLASIHMICGSYPLHILTGQNLTIKEELFETILQADPSIAFKDDVNGDNPISLLWKNTLRFRWAISVMEGATYIDYIRSNDCSWMAVITPHQFIKFSLRMVEAALQQQNGSGNKYLSSVRTIHDICRIPRCPPMLLQLLRSKEYSTLFGVNGTAHTFDEHGMLPLHHAVQKPPVTFNFVPSSLKSLNQKSLVEMLLEENPHSVRVTDDKGRLPLHYALDSGCSSERDIIALIRLYPSSLREVDPVTGLLPFMLVSIDQSTTDRRKNSAIENVDTKSSSPRFEETTRLESDTTSTAAKCQAQWKRDHVKMSCLLLMLCPDAIRCQTLVGLKAIENKNHHK